MTFLKRVLVTALSERQQEIIDVIDDTSCEGLSWETEYDENDDPIEDEEGYTDLEDCLQNCRDTQYFFHDPEALPKGTWLIHFTKHPESIKKTGFNGAHLDFLGLTKGGGRRMEGHHALAYRLYGFNRESWYQGISNYGPDAVIFRADDAVEAGHDTDGERQVIFHIDGVRDMVLLQNKGKGNFILKTDKDAIEVHQDKVIMAIRSLANGLKFPKNLHKADPNIKNDE